MEYISKLVEYADIMEKDFLVIVPIDPPRSQKMTLLQKFFQNMNAKDSYTAIKQRRDEFDALKRSLAQRVSSVKVGLENCGLKVSELTTKELIELYYTIYNPTVARFEKAKEIQDQDIKTDETIVAEETQA